VNKPRFGWLVSVEDQLQRNMHQLILRSWHTYCEDSCSKKLEAKKGRLTAWVIPNLGSMRESGGGVKSASSIAKQALESSLLCL
jgi:hypothetical protein